MRRYRLRWERDAGSLAEEPSDGAWVSHEDALAAIAAERARCVTISRKAERDIARNGSGSRAELTIMVRMRLDVESGAPAPKEG